MVPQQQQQHHDDDEDDDPQAEVEMISSTSLRVVTTLKVRSVRRHFTPFSPTPPTVVVVVVSPSIPRPL